MYRTDTFGSILRGILILFLFQYLLRVASLISLGGAFNSKAKFILNFLLKHPEIPEASFDNFCLFQKAAKLLFALSGR